MEQDLAYALGVDYLETTEMDNDKAWEVVQQEVREGRPTMLTGDVIYLDYRKFKVHFPGHRFVLVGFDDEAEIAYLSDRVAVEPQACSYASVAKSRNPPVGISPFNLWGKFHDTKIKHSLEEACGLALRKNSERMLGQDSSQSDLLKFGVGEKELVVFSGLAGLAAFCREVPDWQAREDAGFIASYMSQCIEKFGTGGGNFRKMYSRFLQWAHGVRPDLVPEHLPPLAERSASRWTAMATTFEEASRDPAQKSLWKRAADQGREILEIETKIFETLGSTTSQMSD
jgi:hypothetical protein